MAANQGNDIFLEQWLQTVSGINGKTASTPSSSSSVGQTIIQAWSDLRKSQKSESFDSHNLQSIKALFDSRVFLYISDSQARILISVLSFPKTFLSQESDPLILRLLYVWLRKSSRHSSSSIDSLVQMLLNILKEKLEIEKNPGFLSEAILVLGTISFVPSVSDKSKINGLELLCRISEVEYLLFTVCDELMMSCVLAGIGYGLCSNVSTYFVRILHSMFGLCEKVDSSYYNTVLLGTMILHTVEWVVSNLLNFKYMDQVNLFQNKMVKNLKPDHSLFALVMVASGLLRVVNRFGETGLMDLRRSSEEVIEFSARFLVSRTWGVNYPDIDPSDKILLQCISLSVTRSGLGIGSVSFRSSSSLLLCIALSLLQEVFPLQTLYRKILDLPNFESTPFDEIKNHLDSITFREAGVITGALINHYVSASEEIKNTVECLIWEYCQNIYFQHQKVATVLRGVNNNNNKLLNDLEKIAESAFLMVVVFALAVTKQRLGSNVVNREARDEISVRILVSFSCMEYFRRIRLPEYMDTIRAVVKSVQGSESACVSFVESLPPYDSLTNIHGLSNMENPQWNWSGDDVQTARVLFYLRVIPTCIQHLPTKVFERKVAPITFLYMGHSNEKMAKASHTLFASFLSSGKDSLEDETTSLKEKLVVYYIQRSLEGYPGLTPFDGLASGVATLVRRLPAGSPAIIYCINCLVEKANNLCSVLKYEENDFPSSLEAFKKILDLHIQLLSLVDIQVLPVLMKHLAQLIVQLPKERQTEVLNELYQQVAESDDVIRKPTLVSWLQSLFYVCSRNAEKSAAKGKSFLVNVTSGNWGFSNMFGFGSRL